MDCMDEWICRQNVGRLRDVLVQASDEYQRIVLMELLAEQARKFLRCALTPAVTSQAGDFQGANQNEERSGLGGSSRGKSQSHG